MRRVKGSVAIVGIGNILRGDDGLGPRLIELLKARPIKAFLFDCGTAPENYIFPILATQCDTLILVDAADIGLPPGDFRVFDMDGIRRVSFSTHNPSPRLFTDLLKTGRDDLNIFCIAGQPKDTSLGAPISDAVMGGVNTLTDIFCGIMA
jgi:hydrogenase 3 maturation protease